MDDSSSSDKRFSDVIGTARPLLWMCHFMQSLGEGFDIEEAWVYAQSAVWVEESDPTTIDPDK